MKKIIVVLFLIIFTSIIFKELLFVKDRGDSVDKPSTNKIEEMLSHMTIEEKIGQMLMPDLRNNFGKSTTEINETIANLIKDYHLGGIILFEKNIINQKQLISLVDDLQNNSPTIPLFISIDQEGGRVKRIPYGTNMPGNMALGAIGSESLAYKVGNVIGNELKVLGINLNFAPVLDININPANPVIGVRSFGAQPDLVSALGVKYLQGLHDAGLAATVKHFPGHGDTDVDSHLGLPVILHDRKRLEDVELKPFREAIANGVEMIMTAHVTLPAIDNSTTISKKDGKKINIPATLSYPIITDLLRKEMNFEGVVISDAFTMKAISDHFGEEEAVIQAINAGVDIILMPNDIKRAYHAILNGVISKEISEERINESIVRILTFKTKHGIIQDTEQVDLNEKIKLAEQIIGSKVNKQIEQEVSEGAVTLLKNENKNLPFAIKDNKRILIIGPSKKDIDIMEESLVKIENEKSIKLQIMKYIYQENGKIKISEKTIDEADYILLETKNLKEEISLAFAKDKPVAVIAIGTPYDIRYVPDAKSYLNIYGSERPNVMAGIRVILGDVQPRGKLPVSIPNKNGDGMLYEIGYGLSY